MAGKGLAQIQGNNTVSVFSLAVSSTSQTALPSVNWCVFDVMGKGFNTDADCRKNQVKLFDEVSSPCLPAACLQSLLPHERHEACRSRCGRGRRPMQQLRICASKGGGTQPTVLHCVLGYTTR